MNCRLCLTACSNKNSLPIFSRETEYNWTFLIAKYFCLQIQENDNFSTTICQRCSGHLEEFHKYCEYIKQCQENLPKMHLEEILPTLDKQTTPQTFTLESSLIKNECISEDDEMEPSETLNHAIVNEASSTSVKKSDLKSCKAETLNLNRQHKEITRALNIILKQNKQITKCVAENNVLLKRSLGSSNKNVGKLFPLRNEESLQAIEEELQTDEHLRSDIIYVINKLLQGNLKNNLALIFDEQLILSHNFDGLKGKSSLKQFGHLLNAIFEGSGYLLQNEFIAELKVALKTHKNRIYKALSRRSEPVPNECITEKDNLSF